jgi:hypothetical protein
VRVRDRNRTVQLHHREEPRATHSEIPQSCETATMYHPTQEHSGLIVQNTRRLWLEKSSEPPCSRLLISGPRTKRQPGRETRCIIQRARASPTTAINEHSEPLSLRLFIPSTTAEGASREPAIATPSPREHEGRRNPTTSPHALPTDCPREGKRAQLFLQPRRHNTTHRFVFRGLVGSTAPDTGHSTTRRD